jgi:hypothetical protein
MTHESFGADRIIANRRPPSAKSYGDGWATQIKEHEM